MSSKNKLNDYWVYLGIILCVGFLGFYYISSCLVAKDLKIQNISKPSHSEPISQQVHKGQGGTKEKNVEDFPYCELKYIYAEKSIEMDGVIVPRPYGNYPGVPSDLKLQHVIQKKSFYTLIKCALRDSQKAKNKEDCLESNDDEYPRSVEYRSVLNLVFLSALSRAPEEQIRALVGENVSGIFSLWEAVLSVEQNLKRDAHSRVLGSRLKALINAELQYFYSRRKAILHMFGR